MCAMMQKLRIRFGSVKVVRCRVDGVGACFSGLEPAGLTGCVFSFLRHDAVLILGC
jgi:hypothetical protein